MTATPPRVKKRILVIEDEESVRKTLERFITLSGFEVTMVASGDEGLKCLAVTTPDLILLDMSLPNADGLTILRELHEKYNHVPVVILAGTQDIPKAQQALNYGAGDYITKPVDLPSLKRMLSVHLPKG